MRPVAGRCAGRRAVEAARGYRRPGSAPFGRERAAQRAGRPVEAGRVEAVEGDQADHGDGDHGP
ncbi:hypothetical protein JIG36_51065 [Actinoplanes sp. LDG1-06]|uniref:Uncharacterized protein n=1 Tax=Paractinoplanes ovalisporus TaxID=2810368 RepID=A0ABS2AVN9_9ACTN|nr:hypothetical protein [Actinoplanes ovalisporus]MBM2623861.1 hypothetical protein [Actinoplanes ovalisporus]